MLLRLSSLHSETGTGKLVSPLMRPTKKPCQVLCYFMFKLLIMFMNYLIGFRNFVMFCFPLGFCIASCRYSAFKKVDKSSALSFDI